MKTYEVVIHVHGRDVSERISAPDNETAVKRALKMVQWYRDDGHEAEYVSCRIIDSN
jgi:hypothetical protein